MTYDLLLNTILPLLYFGVFSWLIIQYKLFAGIIFTSREVLIIFFLKTFWCVAYGIYYQRVGYSDTFDMFNASEQIYRSLFRDPRDFFQLVFLPNNIYFTNGVEHYIRSIDMYGNEGSYFLLRFHALVRFFSFGSYYVHAVFFSFATLPGVMMLLNYFLKQCRDAKFCGSKKDRYLITGLMLLFPGIAFWCSGMHKEALALFSFGLIFHFAGSERITIKNLLLLIAGVFLLGVLRPLFALVFLPFMLATIAQKIFKTRPLQVYFISAIILILIVLMSHLVQINADFISAIEQKRNEFAHLYQPSNSTLPYYLYVVNWIVCGGITVYIIIDSILTNDKNGWTKRKNYFIRIANIVGHPQNASSIMILISSVTCFLIIGYIVVGYGALIRYEAPLLLLLVCSAITLRKRIILTL